MRNVFVYRNLRTRTWSVKFKNKVISHPTEVIIENVTFFVSQKIRMRVVKNKRKEVHAGVKGNLDNSISKAEIDISKMVEVIYNPYLHSSFVEKESLKAVSFADFVFMDSNFKVFAKNPK